MRTGSKTRALFMRIQRGLQEANVVVLTLQMVLAGSQFNGWQWAKVNGAGEGDRTLVLSLENSCSTIELHPHSNTKQTHFWSVPPPEEMVGEVGLEPTKP
jgi:mevalonate kinase